LPNFFPHAPENIQHKIMNERSPIFRTCAEKEIIIVQDAAWQLAPSPFDPRELFFVCGNKSPMET